MDIMIILQLMVNYNYTVILKNKASLILIAEIAMFESQNMVIDESKCLY